MNAQLLDNIQQQTKRLLQQLNELEEFKEELDAEEYQATKKETLCQLEEFDKMLKDLQSGDLTLHNEAKKAQLEIQAAIKKSFNSEEIKQSLTSKDVEAIREKIKASERDLGLGKVSKEEHIKLTVSLINKLDELKTPLTPAEQEFLDTHTGKGNFVDANNKDIEGKKYLQEAKTQFGNQ